MMGDIEFYWMVMRRPDPPQNLRARQGEETGASLLGAGPIPQETKGYLVPTAPGLWRGWRAADAGANRPRSPG